MSRPKYERGGNVADVAYRSGIAPVRSIRQELAVRRPAEVVRREDLTQTLRFEHHAAPKKKKPRSEWPELLLFILLRIFPLICLTLAGLVLIWRNM